MLAGGKIKRKKDYGRQEREKMLENEKYEIIYI
jgi:hypothetical protein